MTLNEYLTTPPYETNCALFVAKWLDVSGKSDLIKRLDRGAMARHWARDTVMAYAAYVFHEERWLEINLNDRALLPGDPVCCEYDGRERMGIWVGPMVAFASTDRSVTLARCTPLLAWMPRA